jgi:hypothetical protein
MNKITINFSTPKFFAPRFFHFEQSSSKKRMENFMKLVRLKSVIKPIQWLESRLKENLFVCKISFAEEEFRKLEINGNQWQKSIETIYSFIGVFFCSKSHRRVRWRNRLFFCIHCLFIYINFSQIKVNSLTCLDWAWNRAKIKPNKHAWHINYTTGDSKLEQIEKKILFQLFLAMQMLDPNFGFMLMSSLAWVFCLIRYFDIKTPREQKTLLKQH